MIQMRLLSLDEAGEIEDMGFLMHCWLDDEMIGLFWEAN